MRGYLIAGALIAVLAASAVALFYRSEAIREAAEAARVRSQLSAAIEANKAAVEALDGIRRQMEIDGRLTAGLLSEMREMNERAAAEDQAQNELENADADVKSYLDTPVPHALCGLYARC